MSIQLGGRDAALRAREQLELEPEGDPDGAPRDSVTDDAGDRPPVSSSGISTYPGTRTLLRPAVYQDPAATINIIPAGYIRTTSSDSNSAPSAFWQVPTRYVARRLLGELGRRLLAPRRAPAPPQSDPRTSPAPPKPPADPRMPFPPVPDPSRPVPEPQPDQQEPQSPGQSEAAPSPDDRPAKPSPEMDNPPSFDFGKALEAYLLQPDNRGTPHTTEGNRILAEECHKTLDEEFKDIAEFTDHVGGSYKNGDIEKYLKELAKDPRRADLSWAMNYLDAKVLAQVNTASMRKDGSLIKREQEAFDELVKQTGKGVMAAMRKLRPGDDVDEYRQEARETCRKIFDELRKKKQEKDRENNSGKLKKKLDKDGPGT
jgi:hypothetical protein